MNRYIMLLGISLLLGGCGNRLSPLEVSEQFWIAVQQGEVRSLQRHILADSARRSVVVEDLLPVVDVEFGRTVINAERAEVETMVTVGDGKTYTFPVGTYLQLEDRSWKVDYDATVSAIRRDGHVGGILDTVKRINEALSHQMQESLAELEGLVPLLERELAILEQSIKDAMPELRRQLEEALQELEEWLRMPDRPDHDSAPIET